jgi:uncharacterized protein (DUF1330 family)
VTAYMIVEVETTDEALMAEYRKHTPALVAKFGGKFIVRGGQTRTLEGGWKPARIVVLEFPDYAAAERFYDSPEYKPVLEMRLKAGNSKAIIVDGHSG